MPRLLRLFGILAGVTLGAAACQWPMVRFGADRTGYSPSETTINPSNVSKLTQQWSTSLVGQASDPVVADGRVFVAASDTSSALNSGLYAFDVAGTPSWSVPYQNPLGEYLTIPQLSAPAASNGTVAVESQFGPCSLLGGEGSVDAYADTTGTRQFVTTGVAGASAPAVANGVIYSSGDVCVRAGLDVPFAELEAADSTTGAARFFAGPANPNESSFGLPAVSHGLLYATLGDTLYAFDATGQTNCGAPPDSYAGLAGSPFCQPLWTATLSAEIDSGAPAVANGYVYVGASDGNLYAFPAAGCGAATCSPSWTAATGGAIFSSVAATPSTLFVGSNDGKLYAFPAGGCGAATCSPSWTATTAGAIESSPSVAGDLVYVGSDDGNLYAFNVSGCGQASCAPAWSTNVGAPVTTSPAIANGQVFVTDTVGGLHVYGLTAGRPTTTAVSSSANPALFNQQVTYTATVTPTPSGGSVSFTDNGSPVSGCSLLPLSGATATCSVTPQTAGAHNIVATYSGAVGYAGSTSPTFTQVVTPPTTTTTAVSSSVNPSLVGQQVTYTATVSPTPRGGSVSFTDNTVPISGCTPSLSGATATCSVTPSCLFSTSCTASQIAGAHNIVATYSGSAGYAGSTSATVTQVVTLNPCNTLAGCNLEGLDFNGANLAGADLTGSNLTNANLGGANLTGANLTDATLSGADLSSTILSGANLTGANLGGVTWNATTCPDGTNSNADGGTCVGHL